jgi:hypothetical protein
VGYDLILGFPWLQEADPWIRFSQGTFDWWPEEAERLQVVTEEELFSDLQPNEEAYLMHLSDLRMTQLDRAKYREIQEALRAALGRPLDREGKAILGAIADEKRDSLKWLKDHIEYTVNYLKRCVRGHPKLQELP